MSSHFQQLLRISFKLDFFLDLNVPLQISRTGTPGNLPLFCLTSPRISTIPAIAVEVFTDRSRLWKQLEQPNKMRYTEDHFEDSRRKKVDVACEWNFRRELGFLLVNPAKKFLAHQYNHSKTNVNSD